MVPKHHADFVSYAVYKSTSPDTLGDLVTTITNKATTSFTIFGLSPNTTYYFTIRVNRAAGAYSDSNQMSTTTSGAPFELILYLETETAAQAASWLKELKLSPSDNGAVGAMLPYHLLVYIKGDQKAAIQQRGMDQFYDDQSLKNATMQIRKTDTRSRAKYWKTAGYISPVTTRT